MDAFAGDNPQALALGQAGVFQQAAVARFAGVGDAGAVGQYGILGLVADAQQRCHSSYRNRHPLQ